MICSCSGIVILCKPLVTTVLTSASLVRSSHDESKIDDGLRVHAANLAQLLLHTKNVIGFF
jgi:hypothetical protein